MSEIWKDIEGYEGLYQVSNLGRVKSLERVVNSSKGRTRKVSERILKYGLKGNGYLIVSLSRGCVTRCIYVHRLVAQAFLHRKMDATEVNHKNGNKKHNEVSNLEWVTRRENMEHSFSKGLHPRPRKVVHMSSIDGCLIRTFPSTVEAARYLGKYQGGICNACNGRQKTAYGYKWKYASEGESL